MGWRGSGPSGSDVGSAALRTRSVVVAHVGLMGEEPGGMAQVVNEYLTWKTPALRTIGVKSTRRRSDPLAVLLSARALAALAVLRLARRRRTRPTVAVFHLSERGSFVREGALLVWAHAIGIPTIAHLHGAIFETFAASRPALVAAVLRRADSVAVLTTGSADTVRRLLGADAPVSIVPNAVTVPALVPDKQDLVVFGGEVGLRKGVDVLLEAWQEVGPELTGWTLVLAGPRSADFALPSLLPASTSAVGAITHSALLELLDRAAVAVLPSRNEALPMFLLEAAARGCALIGSRVGQVPQLIGTDAGVLVEPGDAAELAAALRTLTTDRAETMRYGRAARTLVEAEYSATTARRRLEALWIRVATGR